jgi:antitoxin MazE
MSVKNRPHKSRIIPIGNSQGFRVPKLLLEQCGIESDVEMWVEENRLVIQASKKPRQGWRERFKAMSENGDDKLLDDITYSTTNWDKQEWEWQ